ncbi:MAG: YbaN family protein [Candidatus Cloacimonetes bacterium]|nr:YbaN family protein [Candidatus Cloacimonadota bacterium]
MISSNLRKKQLTTNSSVPSRSRLIKKLLWTVLGSIFLVSGIIGVFLPVLPTTPFLLLTAACYFRGSEDLYQWTINIKWFGEYIKNYREKKGIPVHVKIVTILVLWLTITISAMCFIKLLYVRLILFVIAISVTIHIVLIKKTKHSQLNK